MADDNYSANDIMYNGKGALNSWKVKMCKKDWNSKNNKVQ